MRLKRYAIADEVPEEYTCWFTSGKEYELEQEMNDGLAVVTDDDNIPSLILLSGCGFLNGKSWRIVEREE